MTSNPERNIHFGASLQLFALRTACTSLVLAVFLLAGDFQAQSSASTLDVLVVAPLIVVAATLFWGTFAWLGNLGVPYMGLLALPMMLIVIVGDPLLFVLHAATKSKWPDLIPVERLRFVNFAAFIVAVELPDRGQV